jgi:hypothetical protein
MNDPLLSDGPGTITAMAGVITAEYVFVSCVGCLLLRRHTAPHNRYLKKNHENFKPPPKKEAGSSVHPDRCLFDRAQHCLCVYRNLVTNTPFDDKPSWTQWLCVCVFLVSVGFLCWLLAAAPPHRTPQQVGGLEDDCVVHPVRV